MFVNEKLIFKNLGLSIKYKLCNYTKNEVHLYFLMQVVKENKLQNGFLNVCVGKGCLQLYVLIFLES